MNVLSFLVI